MCDTQKILNKLNTYSCEPQRKLLLRNMEINKKFDIISANRHYKPRSGKSVIKLILNNYYIYLPVRYNILPDYFLNEINVNKKFQIENCGRWRKTFRLIFSNSAEAEVNEIQEFFKNFCYYTPSVEQNIPNVEQ